MASLVEIPSFENLFLTLRHLCRGHHPQARQRDRRHRGDATAGVAPLARGRIWAGALGRIVIPAQATCKWPLCPRFRARACTRFGNTAAFNALTEPLTVSDRARRVLRDGASRLLGMTVRYCCDIQISVILRSARRAPLPVTPRCVHALALSRGDVTFFKIKRSGSKREETPASRYSGSSFGLLRVVPGIALGNEALSLQT